MTQFQPPPDLPGAVYPGQDGAPVGGAPPRWSAAAVSGFVLSLLGCTGIGAVLGLILGFVGIAATRGGRRRGMGLAIAAIPISLITGLVGALVGWLGFLGLRMVTDTPEQLLAIMGTRVASVSEGADALRDVSSDGFRAEVNAEAIEAWLTKVWGTHGRLTGSEPDKTNPGGTMPGGNPFLGLEGKFVNGPANITVVFDAGSVWSTPEIVDIEVDGVSPRDSD